MEPMRVTLDIPDFLHQQLKIKAAAEGVSMKQIVVTGLRKFLARRRRSAHRKARAGARHVG